MGKPTLVLYVKIFVFLGASLTLSRSQCFEPQRLERLPLFISDFSYVFLLGVVGTAYTLLAEYEKCLQNQHTPPWPQPQRSTRFFFSSSYSDNVIKGLKPTFMIRPLTVRTTMRYLCPTFVTNFNLQSLLRMVLDFIMQE
jgi:hypothetical protein